MNRTIVVTGLAGAMTALVALGLAGPGAAAGCAPTPSATEGPYYTPGTPMRSRIATRGTTGTPLMLTGVVRDTSCRRIAGATVDVWQADGTGRYDNRGYRLRGRVRADAHGAWTVRTVVPGRYPGRTEHIHVKVSAPGGPVTTTQLYLPGASGNAGDPFFQAALLIRGLRRTSTPWTATYPFVVRR